jgi:hypothetical protein
MDYKNLKMTKKSKLLKSNNTDISIYTNKLIIITQYYKVKNPDLTYLNERQQEIDMCLIKNAENSHVYQIHLLVEQHYNLDFIDPKLQDKIIQVVINKRLTYLDAFKHYNSYIPNSICILLNADIYTNSSLSILQNVKFDNAVFALNRYEVNNFNKPSLLNGMECNASNMKKCESFLKPYQESIWSQDGWIWKSPKITENSKFDFELGIIGCDNYIITLLLNVGYNVLNSSRLICINHYDCLSIIQNEFGISKGNISKKYPKTIKSLEHYTFIENIDEVPDKYTTNIIHSKKYTTNNKINITETKIEKNISEIFLQDSQIIASSYLNEKFSPKNAKFTNDNCWMPSETVEGEFIQFNFDNAYEVVIIDITGMPVNKDKKTIGHVNKFKI